MIDLNDLLPLNKFKINTNNPDAIIIVNSNFGKISLFLKKKNI